ncbi:MAG: lysine--tRNA ligase [Microgenomates group bacterium]
MSRIDETIQAKKEKRLQLESLGISAHPHSFDKQLKISEVLTKNDQRVQTAGRILRLRTHGKVQFFDLVDDSGQIQIMVREEEIGEKVWNWLNFVDRGDFIGVSGIVMSTKTGQITILADSLTFLGKALRPLPTEFNAAADKEVRFRKRYIDMLINESTKKILDARWLITKEIRRFLQDEHNFTEVETPILQPLYGGTNATPFITHMDALDTDYYLRIAPELYLKRLIVGGYDKVFEIARNFRNEGIDQTHQPEFTMIEWYEAYADYHRMMDVTEGLYKHLAQKLNGHTKIQVGEKSVDLGGSWPRIPMDEALKSYANIDISGSSDDDLKSLLTKNEITLKSSFTRGKAMFELFDVLVTPHLIEPTWIINYPRDISPLAKHHRDHAELAERFEGYVGGKEIADGWSEITDPIDQRRIFDVEQSNMRSGDNEAHPLDEDFLEAMEYGMPPLGGIGIGIDRLVMFLTNTWSIKEVIAFPTLKPLVSAKSNIVSGESKEMSASTAAKNGGSMIVTPHSKDTITESTPLPPREDAEKLLESYIANESLRHHCKMVARALEAYAKDLGEDAELWYQTGLLHDLDWEQFPDEHPNRAISEILIAYPAPMLQAIAAHAPERTGVKPTATLDRYLYACDELSGFLHAYSLMRPEGFAGMKFKSVNKKLKDKAFAANVNRDDIREGFALIGKEPSEHVEFLIGVFG